MTASITFYNNWKAAIAEVVPRTATFKVTLHTSSYTFAATHNVYADLTNELATANGYTNGGLALASVTWTQTSGTATFDAAEYGVDRLGRFHCGTSGGYSRRRHVQLPS
jgi:hypothetical protein